MPKAAKTKTAFKDRRPDFGIADKSVRSGTASRFEVPVAQLPTGTSLSLPITVLHGSKPGPTVWISAAIHGDELNGVPVILSVLRRLDPMTLNGTLIAVPVVNVVGLVNESRYLPDRRDLNRSFPGSKRGSLAGQIARLFMEEVVSRCDFGLDLHTGSNGRFNLPQIRCDLDEPRAKTAALRFGAPLVLHAALRDSSLRAAARELQIPVLLYEAGEAGRFDALSVELGIEGVLRVLKSLGMHEEPTPEPAKASRISRSSHWVRARRGGFLGLEVTLGQEVQAGDVLGTVFDTVGHDRVRLRADRAGMVIAVHQGALINRGDAAVHLAEFTS